nr:atherin-like [Maniola hyperantus]
MALLHAPRGAIAALFRPQCRLVHRHTQLGAQPMESETASSVLQIRRPASARAREPAPCAPCAHAPRPPCRRPAPSAARGLRVTCCAPPPRTHPPCAPPAAPRARTCSHAAAQAKEPNSCTVQPRDTEHRARCGQQLHSVARRLAAADAVRRAHYEHEVQARHAPPSPAPAPYRLHDERECLRATDGRPYAVSPAAARRCGPGRTPPPPCPVHVEPFDRCELRRGAHLDPCSHRPRIFLDVDRTPPPSPATPAAPERPAPSGGLATRIMETFRRSAPAADAGRCTRAVPPAPAPPPCAAPSVTERLRRRPRGEGAPCCDPRREFHTSTGLRGANCPPSRPDTSKSIDVESGESVLEVVLRARERLEEAGRGRVVAPEGAANEASALGAGGLELKVPPSAEAVRVRVLLDFSAAPVPCLPAPCLPAPCLPAPCLPAPSPPVPASNAFEKVFGRAEARGAARHAEPTAAAAQTPGERRHCAASEASSRAGRAMRSVRSVRNRRANTKQITVFFNV